MQGAVKIPCIAIDLRNDGIVRKALGDLHGDIEGGGLVLDTLLDIPVRQSDLDGVVGKASLLSLTLGLDLLEHLTSFKSALTQPSPPTLQGTDCANEEIGIGKRRIRGGGRGRREEGRQTSRRYFWKEGFSPAGMSCHCGCAGTRHSVCVAMAPQIFAVSGFAGRKKYRSQIVNYLAQTLIDSTTVPCVCL